MTAPIIENTYTGDGSTVLFSFTFEYIEATDIEVSVDAVTVATTSYSLANSTTVEFNTAPAVGAAIRIYRNTTVLEPKATFFPGSAIRAQDLNDNFEQILFVTQEADAISERAETAADAAQIATTAAQTAAASATSAANTAQTAASTAQAQVTAAQTAASAAATDAANAVSTANSAVTTANTANTNATAAAANASAAAASAAAAATDAAAAQTSASNAQTSATNALTQSAAAQTAATSAQSSATNAAASATVAANNSSTAVTTANSAVTTANTAATDASAALTAANNAVTTANAASTTANTASTDASTAVTTANGAVTTANTAASDAATAVSTANTASTNANTAITNAATAQTTANSAVTTANAASTTANTASSLATTTAAAVANAYLFNNVAAVANIPSSPSNNDAVRVVNSTNIESTSSVQGVPSGFVGDAGINVEIIYSSSAGKWNYIAYNANDPDDRYGYPPYVDVTRQNTVDAAALSGVALNSTDLGTFTGSTIADSSTIKAALQSLETEVETKADLVGGVVPTSQLPALAITTFLGTVANQTAMLALSGQRGDFAIRTDTGSTFVLTSDGGSNIAHWQELETPTDAIQTVNGQTGTVVLGHSDVGAVSAASGGTFSGNIEISTGIDLNTDGTAAFAGSVTIAGGVTSNSGIAAYSAGQMSIRRDGSSADAIEILNGGNSSSNKVATIKNDGSATFDSNVTIGGNITVSGTVDGRDVASDGSKLDGIESGATADQTASEILSLIKTVDGAGSGLDAAALEGLGSGSFLRSNADDVKTSGYLRWNDNVAAVFGSGNDADLYCNGSHLYLDLKPSIANFYIRDGTTTRFTFDDGGDFTATGNVTAYSDIRLKKDIEVIPNALDKVLSLRGVTYTDIELGNRRTGVIAQEVQAVLPEAVQENEEYLSVAYGNLVGVLIESIKELEARVRELECR